MTKVNFYINLSSILGYKHVYIINWKRYWSAIGEYYYSLAEKSIPKLEYFYSQLVPIFNDISSISCNIDFALRFEFLRNRARGTCEGVLTVWHATTICKHIKVVRPDHVVISPCKPRKQLNYVSVLQITCIKHILGAIWFMQPVSVVVVLKCLGKNKRK